MDLSIKEAQRIYQSEKYLIEPIRWEDVPNRKYKSPQSKIECRISINDAIQRNIFFRIVSNPVYPQTLMFQLEVNSLDSRTNIPLYRLDVNPSSAHTNLLTASDELSGLFFQIGETHEHIFLDNLTNDGSEIRKQSDAIARRINEPPDTFMSCLNYICGKLNIMNYNAIPNITDQGSLL